MDPVIERRNTETGQASYGAMSAFYSELTAAQVIKILTGGEVEVNGHTFNRVDNLEGLWSWRDK